VKALSSRPQYHNNNKTTTTTTTKNKPGLVANTCNPSYLGDEGRKIKVPGCPEQKHETLSKKTKKQKHWRYSTCLASTMS
jgi:hypothetical protein